VSLHPPDRTIDHIGLTVPDLDVAGTFFEAAFGYAELYRLGRLDENDAWMRENLNLPPGTELDGILMMGCESGALLELFQYRAEGRRTNPPGNADIGGNHVAFYVDDIDAAAETLPPLGAKLNGKAKTVTAGPLEGLRWLYFLAPWGQQLELVSYPDGLRYMRDVVNPLVAMRRQRDDGR
jgi:catechol 2,3-dioxygenase-like lactoylglutathione lyase family enzyme